MRGARLSGPPRGGQERGNIACDVPWLADARYMNAVAGPFRLVDEQRGPFDGCGIHVVRKASQLRPRSVDEGFVLASIWERPQ